MQSISRSILLVPAESTHRELACQVRYLKVENDFLRSRLERRLTITPSERRRLVKFAAPVGRAIRHLASIVAPETLMWWIREDRRSVRKGKPWTPRAQGRRRTSLAVRLLILKLGRETGWGYTRILGELKKLGVKPRSRNTIKKILKSEGLDPESPRGAGT